MRISPLVFLLFSSYAMADFSSTNEKFHDLGCRSSFNLELVAKHGDHEYDILVDPDYNGRTRKAILYTKTAVFSGMGKIDDGMAVKQKKNQKVKLENGFSEEWEVYEESAECTKLWKQMASEAKPKAP